MSVAPLTAREFGIFAGICVKLEKAPLADVCQLCEIAAIGNRAAYRHQYREEIEAVTADDVKREALHALANPARLIDEHFGPLAYNMISNDGTAYDHSGETQQDGPALESVRSLEKVCHDWQEAKTREKARQEADDEAYTEVGPLEVLTGDEIKAKCEAAGCQRVIIAEFGVNETDTQTDYFGGRTARTVVIGFGKGKRENFRQLRKAAGLFPPTSMLGPGCDDWTVEANRSPDDDSYQRGELLRGDSHTVCSFDTRAEAEAAVAALISTSDECREDYTGCVGFPRAAQRHGVQYLRGSIEHRENYSMGGGNYLGYSRYGGWKVSSRSIEWGAMDGEFFEPPRKVKTTKQDAPPAAPETTPPRSDVGGVTLTENEAKGGIELRFPSKPADDVRQSLKSNGWRWSRRGGCWWIKASDAAREFAAELAGDAPPSAQKSTDDAPPRESVAKPPATGAELEN